MFKHLIVKAAVLLSCLFFSACNVEKTALKAINIADNNSHYEKTADIIYGPDKRQRMDYYQPVFDDSALPDSGITVVFVHGGAWRTGSKDEYEFIASTLTKQGHSVLVPGYRLYPQVTFPEFIDDIALAIASLENRLSSGSTTSSAPLDKLVLMGHSSGAHQIALLLTDKSYFESAGLDAAVDGLIALSGPYDLPLDLPEVALVFPNVVDQQAVNPVLQAKNMDAEDLSGKRVLLLHGKEDERVLSFHSVRFAAALKHAGASVEVDLLKGGHAGVVLAIAMPLQFLNDSLQRVEEFLSDF